MEEYRSRVYTNRPEYADYDSARKFQALEGIIIRRLTEHPNAICSYSGGSEFKALKIAEEKAKRAKNKEQITFEEV